jgi:hypothetical protein
LQAFKEFVHRRLDEMGIEKEPNGKHSAQGCRIGDRLDIVASSLRGFEDALRYCRRHKADTGWLHDPDAYVAGLRDGKSSAERAIVVGDNGSVVVTRPVGTPYPTSLRAAMHIHDETVYQDVPISETERQMLEVVGRLKAMLESYEALLGGKS